MPPALIRPTTSGLTVAVLTRLLDLPEPTDPAAASVVLHGVSLDSRAIAAGDLYAALPGFNVHGARFAADALGRGAVAVLTDADGAEALHGLAVEVPVIVSTHPREVLGRVSAAVYATASQQLSLIGVTGTNGKTTTAYLIESALRALGHRTGLIGTVETRIGDERVDSERTTPETTDLHAILAVMQERGIDTCVMEVSSHALELHRVDGVHYDVVLFTNLSQDHLDFHESMEAYFAAKAKLFTPERARRGVVCVDDDWGRRLADQATIPVTTLTTSDRGDRVADWHVTLGDNGAFTLTAQTGTQTGTQIDTPGQPGRRLDLVSHLPGTFNVANTAMAALALLESGAAAPDVAAAMAASPEVPGRMEVVAEGGPSGPRCIVDFAHTPDAVDAALAALRQSTPGRLIAVLGAGGDRDAGKRAGMGAAAARRADVVVVTDDNPRSEEPASIRDAVAAGAHAEIAAGTATAQDIVDGGARTAAIAEAIAMAVLDAAQEQAVDTVVILGKGHEKGQEIHGVKHPFDDRDAVRAALEAAGVKP